MDGCGTGSTRRHTYGENSRPRGLVCVRGGLSAAFFPCFGNVSTRARAAALTLFGSASRSCARGGVVPNGRVSRRTALPLTARLPSGTLVRQLLLHGQRHVVRAGVQLECLLNVCVGPVQPRFDLGGCHTGVHLHLERNGTRFGGPLPGRGSSPSGVCTPSIAGVVRRPCHAHRHLLGRARSFEGICVPLEPVGHEGEGAGETALGALVKAPL